MFIINWSLTCFIFNHEKYNFILHDIKLLAHKYYYFDDNVPRNYV